MDKMDRVGPLNWKICLILIGFMLIFRTHTYQILKKNNYVMQ